MLFLYSNKIHNKITYIIVHLFNTVFFIPQFTYKADRNQLSFLQLLSSSAYQKLTYHCKNSIAVADARKRTYRNALKILTISDAELNARGNSKYRYTVEEDGCKVNRYLNVNIKLYTNRR